MKGKNIRKLAAFMATVMAMASVGTMSVSAISINCPVEGKWVSMSSTAEGTKWFMADGSVVTEDKNGNITQTAPTKPATTTTASSGASNTSSSETASNDFWTVNKDKLDPSIKPDTYNHIIEQLIFDYTNEERVKAGLPELVWSKGLTEYAETRAKEMSVSYSHVRPNGAQSLGGRENGGYIWTKDLDDLKVAARSVVNAWMDSDKHREAILSYEVDEYGDVWGSQSLAVGVYVDDDGSVHAVQVFNAQPGIVGTTVFDDLEAGLMVSPFLVDNDLERYNELIKSN